MLVSSPPLGTVEASVSSDWNAVSVDMGWVLSHDRKNDIVLP